jgi:ribonuclease P/MRP protein subunit RPP25
MEGYKKRDKPKEKTEENEIRVTSKGFIRNYVTYAEKVLEKEDQRSLIISATGNAIVKALILIEMVKRRVGDLHQVNEITSREMVDYFEPMIEGLESIEQKRRVTAMKTVLSKDPLDNENIGYQTPEPKEELPPRRENDRPPR